MENNDTGRRNSLYQYIEFQQKFYDHNPTILEIAKDVPGYEIKVSQSNYTNCPKLYKDINEINKDPNFENIIVVNNGVVYFGIKDDCIAYADKLLAKALKILATRHGIMKKIKRDGQGIIDFEKQDVDFLKSFYRELNEFEESEDEI